MQIGLSLSLTAQLRLSTSAYVVSGFDPALVFDFKSDYYKTGGADTTFSPAITHTASTNATMVDSDGLLKWRPHNRVTSSGDLASTSWSAIRATYDGPTETLTQVGTTVQGLVTQAPASLTVGARYKYTIRMKAGNTGWGVVAHVMTNAFWVKAWFDLSNGVVGTVGANTTATIVNAGDGWWDCSVEAVANRTVANISAQTAASDNTTTAADGDTVLVRQVHAYRSDLGGMVNNPDTNSSYVPTTTTPVYLSRRGQHLYNGSAWVNEGILHESEARTNLLLHSGALSTQSATVAAVANTLSFTGTGTVTLSGASTAGPLVGTGAGENNRVSLTFTPTAGTLTLAVSGTVTNAQLEAGATASSYIPTGFNTATRAAETLTVPAANLPYSSTNMSIQMDGKMTYADRGLIREVQFVEWLADTNNGIEQFACSGTGFFPNGAVAFFQEASAATSLRVTPAATLPFGVNVPFNISSRHGSTFLNGAVGGTALTADTTPTALPNLSSTDLNLGSTFMGTIGQFRMWDEDITDAGITEAST